MSVPILELDGVTRQLTDPDLVTLVKDITFSVSEGEFVVIMGPSGCGKSSLLYLMGLLDRPTTGQIRFDGQPMDDLSADARTAVRLERIGFVFQFHFLLPELTALANVALPMHRLGRLSRVDAEARAEMLLAKLGLTDAIRRRPDRMSGGQRQRVAIARALANDPAIILCDEPTGNLDSGNTRVVIEEFQRLAHDEGRAIVCVTHDASVAAAADRRIHMLDGRIERDGD